MKTRIPNLFVALVLLNATLASYAQGTAFTYQGRLKENGSAANGTYDLQFSLRDASAGGNAVGGTNTLAPIAVSNGLFTVMLDFGAGIFAGGDRWLEIGVKSNGVAGAHIPLTPRQRLTPSPYAIFASGAQTATTVATGSVSSGSIAVGAVNSSAIADSSIQSGDLSAPLLHDTFWRLNGNTGTTPGVHSLGTTDNQALEFKVNGTRALRLEPNAGGTPNVIGGSPINSVGAGWVGATIGGGGSASYGLTNRVEGSWGTVSGGAGNTIQGNADAATIGGGYLNTIQYGAGVATIGGGNRNMIQHTAYHATIGGGFRNMIQPFANSATIPGGEENSATNYAFAAGRRAKADHTGAFIWADATDADFPSTGDNQFLIRAAGGVGLNKNNPATALDVNGVVTATGFSGNQALEFKVNDTRALRLEPNTGGAPNVIGGSPVNFAEPGIVGATVAGGGAVSYQGFPSTNKVTADFGTVSGGMQNTSSGPGATVGGGSLNTSSGVRAAVGGGIGNISSGSYATVPGGYFNSASGLFSFAAGRSANAIHDGSFVWADSQNNYFASTAINQLSVRAAGGVRLSDDTPNISFGAQTRQMLNLWGTSYGIGVQADTLYFRCDANPGNVYTGFRWYRGGTHQDGNGNAGGGTELMSLGSTYLYVNGTFLSSSDRNKKDNFASIQPREVLEKVVALPITRWSYKSDGATPHLGPMAQDFHAAFGLGTDDKHIATVDADGVALAAIQGLNQKLEEQRAENTELKQRLDALEKIVRNQKSN